MSKFILSVFFLLLVLSVNSQEIPNGNFETWIKATTYEDPQYWSTPNMYLSTLMVTTVNKEIADVQSGIYSAKLENIEIMGGLYRVPGFMTLGAFTVDLTTMKTTIFGGIPFTNTPKKMKGYVNYTEAVAGDEGMLAVALFKYDSIAGKSDTVAAGYLNVKNTGGWKMFDIWLDYKSFDQPDSMNIVVISSKSLQPPKGTIMRIDSLFFDYTTSIAPNSADQLDYYISGNKVFFKNIECAENICAIYDIFGHKLKEEKISSNSYIELPQSGIGIYILRINQYSVKIILQ